MKDILDRSRSLSVLSDPGIRMANAYTQNLDVIQWSLLAGIADPSRHINDALNHNELYDCLTRVRSAHEAHWEERLKEVHWEIDSSVVLEAFANGRPIEQACFSFLSGCQQLMCVCSQVPTSVDLCAFAPSPSPAPSVYCNLTRSTRALVVLGEHLPGFERCEHPGFISQELLCTEEWRTYTTPPICGWHVLGVGGLHSG
jgi:hypothetical protein